MNGTCALSATNIPQRRNRKHSRKGPDVFSREEERPYLVSAVVRLPAGCDIFVKTRQFRFFM